MDESGARWRGRTEATLGIRGAHQADRVASRVSDERIARPPEGVVWLLLRYVAGSDELCVEVVDVVATRSAKTDDHAVPARPSAVPDPGERGAVEVDIDGSARRDCLVMWDPVVERWLDLESEQLIEIGRARNIARDDVDLIEHKTFARHDVEPRSWWQTCRVIDLRSDTVTRPTPAMRAAMHEAEVGDDVYGDDPTVHRLEETVADLLGKEAAVYVSSGTQSNLCALLAHCSRGDEYIVGRTAHAYRSEGGGAAVLGSIQPEPLPFEADGSIDLDAVEATIKPDNHHFARTRLFSLENTKDGKVVPQDYIERAADVAKRHSLGFHLDGARLWNAAAHHGVEPGALVGSFDSVSVCLSKGMGAPVGSVLVGSSELIAEARKYRKMLGGGMRQAGVIAAAGLHAVEHHRHRMVDDHANAEHLASLLNEIDGISAAYGPTQTNMVFTTFERDASHLEAALAASDIVVGINPLYAPGQEGASGGSARLVTHLDVDRAGVERVAEAVAAAY